MSGLPTAAGPLAVQAELLRLARLLRVGPGELDALAPLPLHDLRALRLQVIEALFDHDDASYQKLSAAVRVLPGGLVATIAQKAFGPALCARVAGRLDPGRAADLAKRLPVAFLAELCADLDPRRAADVVSQIPMRQVRVVARELMTRGDHVTAASLVGHLTDDVLDDVIGSITSDDLLRIAFLVDDVRVLDGIVLRAPDDTLQVILRTALDGDLWSEGLALLVALSPDGQDRIVPLLADELAASTADLRRRALELAEALGVVDDLGPLAAVLAAD